MSEKNPSLAPSLLVAMPQLQDPNFHRSVVLLCEHHESGAMGLVVNRETDTLTSEIVDFQPPVDDAGCHMGVSIGGPVDPERGWLLLSESVGDGVEISPGVFLSASSDLLRDFVEGKRSGCQSRFLVGYAGWGPKQLDREIADSAWLVVPVNPHLLFETESDDVWELAIRQLGVEPSALTMGRGVH